MISPFLLTTPHNPFSELLNIETPSLKMFACSASGNSNRIFPFLFIAVSGFPSVVAYAIPSLKMVASA